MKKVINVIKQNILGFIIGSCIFGSISVYAASPIFSSKDVEYTNNNMNATNVQSAIDELNDKLVNPITPANATASQILSGQTAWVNGTKITGSMVNQGKITKTLNPGETYTIPAGYHDGSGVITINPNQNSGTYTYAANSTGATVDLGVNNSYRYVNATNVYNKGKADGIASTSSKKNFVNLGSSSSGNISSYVTPSSISASNFIIGVTRASADAVRVPGNGGGGGGATIYPSVSYNSSTGAYSVTGTYGNGDTSRDGHVEGLSVTYNVYLYY